MNADEWSFRVGDQRAARDSWSQMLSSTHLPWDITELESDPGRGFGASVRRRHLADLVLVDCSCDPCAGARRGYEIGRTDDEYLVMLMTLGGREVVVQGDRESQLTSGSIVAWDSAAPARFLVQEPLVKRSLFVPKSALSEVGARGELLTGSVLDGDAPAVILLRNYLDALARTIDDLPLSALPAARNATIELLVAALQAPAEAPGVSPLATRHAAERYIDRNLAEHQLSPVTVAAGLGISVRSLHRAFEDSGETVSGFIRLRRLARAHDDLLAGTPVSQVARRWRFADPSHFSRSFKRYYGHSPSELTFRADAAR